MSQLIVFILFANSSNLPDAKKTKWQMAEKKLKFISSLHQLASLQDRVTNEHVTLSNE